MKRLVGPQPIPPGTVGRDRAAWHTRVANIVCTTLMVLYLVAVFIR